MGFVKTREEIERIQAALARPRFVNSQMLIANFLTTEEKVTEILPPGFEPAAEPRVTVQLGSWQSNCCGDFNGGALTVACRYGGREGEYALCMYMNRDEPILYGRDLFGEPKKLAEASLFKRPDGFVGWVERHGVRLFEIAVRADNDAGPATVVADNFNIKARPAADGVGLEEDAIVTCATFENELRVNVEGAATVRLGGTVHDPLDDFEVVSVLGGRYIEVDMEAVNRAVGTIPAADYEPYFYGRGAEDWSALATCEAPLAVSA